MSRVRLALGLLWCLLSASVLSAQNRVIVESKTCAPGQDACTVGVFITNDVELNALVLCFESRTLSGGAYMRSGLRTTFRGIAANRLAASPLGTAGEDERGSWPQANISYRTYAYPTSGICIHPPDTYMLWGGEAPAVDISPDAMSYATASTGFLEIEPTTLLPGSDSLVTSKASFWLVLNLKSDTGEFEIDEACYYAVSRVSFFDTSGALIRPEFTKGIIRVMCDCSCHGDPGCDGEQNVVDIVMTADRAFAGEPVTQDADCPHHYSGIDGRTDVDCSGATDIVDVVKLIDVTFRGGDPSTQFCQPCAL